MTSAPRIALMAADPLGPEALSCLDAYFAELARVFEGGFDPGEQGYAGRGEGAPPEVYCVLARSDGHAVACGFLYWNAGNSVGEIKRMWVVPQLRGKGIARAILSNLEERAASLGLVAVRLDTNRVLAGARALYLRSGYTEIARYNDNPYAHHWFAKNLKPPQA